MDKKIRGWVKQALRLGHDINLIKYKLKEHGYDERIVDEVLNELEGNLNFDSVPDYVVRWVKEAIEKGHDLEAIKRKLYEHGYNPMLAEHIHKKKKSRSNAELLSREAKRKAIVSGMIFLLLMTIPLYYMYGPRESASVKRIEKTQEMVEEAPGVSEELLQKKELAVTGATSVKNGFLFENEGAINIKKRLPRQFTIKIRANATPLVYRSVTAWKGRNGRVRLISKNETAWPIVSVKATQSEVQVNSRVEREYELKVDSEFPFDNITLIVSKPVLEEENVTIIQPMKLFLKQIYIPQE